MNLVKIENLMKPNNLNVLNTSSVDFLLQNKSQNSSTFVDGNIFSVFPHNPQKDLLEHYFSTY